MPIKAVIFDFDGLILDTETAEYEAWRELYAEHDLELPISLWASNIGGYTYEHFHPYEYLMENAKENLEEAHIHVEKTRRHLDKVLAASVRDGIANALEYAKEAGLKIGLASSSDQEWVLGHLERLNLRNWFEVICCGDMVERIKPDPALYTLALERLTLMPGEAFALEDSAKGVAAAKAAGLYCVAVTNPVSLHLDLSAADLVLGSLADITFAELLRSIEETR